jgi:hypothetical protein
MSEAPAGSNPFAALFGQAAPDEAPAQSSAERQCLLQPGKATTASLRWVYRSERRRKCWFQTAERMKPLRDRAEAAAAPRLDTIRTRWRNKIADARDKLLRLEPPQPSEPARRTLAVDVVEATTPGPATRAEALMPLASVLLSHVSDQLISEHVEQQRIEENRRPIPATSDPDATPPAASAVSAAWPRDAARSDQKSRTSWPGVLLIWIGLVCLLSSSRSLRGVIFGWR